MTWRDKLEIGLKEDAPFRRDNLPPDEIHGRMRPAGPGRSPIVTAAQAHAAGTEAPARPRKPRSKKRLKTSISR
jgi:hypothetical protein